MKWNVYDTEGNFVGIAHGETKEQAMQYCQEQMGVEAKSIGKLVEREDLTSRR